MKIGIKRNNDPFLLTGQLNERGIVGRRQPYFARMASVNPTGTKQAAAERGSP